MPDMSAIANPQQRRFNPYTENGGTILAVAGADFTVIAGDTRQSEGYSIQTRYAPKVFRLFVQLSLECPPIMVIALTYYPCRTDRAVLAVNGFAADGNTFVKKVKQRLEVRLVLFDTISQKGIHSFHVASGTDTTTQRICLSAQSRV
jgi:20S proteasome subunit beta 6